jgi:hypothetical protein
VINADSQGSDVVKTLGQVVGLAAGFIALMYAAGGGVLALRLFLADLPSRTVVGQLPRDLLISVGLAQIVLPALAVAALYAMGRLLMGATPPPTRLVCQWKERSWRGWLVLVAASAIPALLAMGVMALGVDRERLGWKGLLWLLPVTFLLTLFVVLVALNLRARLADRYSDPESLWNTRRPVLSMTLVVALASLPACVIFAGTINLLDAKVCTKSLSAEGMSVEGVLIGETSDRTYIGQKETSDRTYGQENRRVGPLLVFSVPLSQITATFIGGDAGLRDCPAQDSNSG